MAIIKERYKQAIIIKSSVNILGNVNTCIEKCELFKYFKST